VGNLLNVLNNSSSVFSVSQTKITSALPHEFTAAGDISAAYDLVFTNPTASYIKSNAPLIVQSGFPYNSSNLSLQTYNSGNIVFENLTNGVIATLLGSNGNVGIGTTNPASKLSITSQPAAAGQTTGKAAFLVDQYESQDIFTASSSGTTKLKLT